jgi:branched-chain amino acid transport system ATP-binding protein
MLEVHGLSKSFGGFFAVTQVNLAVAEGQIAAIIGPNGAGKTTLFNLITGHLRPTAGRVLVYGRDITGVSPHRICRLGMGRSFQHTNIFPKLTVFGWPQMTGDEIEEGRLAGAVRPDDSSNLAFSNG